MSGYSIGARARRLARCHGDFGRLWAGETVSLLGSEITVLALPLVAILELHASPAQLGILTAARWAPYLALTLPAGVWVDRHRRRPVLVAADLGQAGLLLAVPVLAALGALGIGGLVVVAFGVGTCSVFFELAYRAYLPAIVEHDELTEANSKLSVSQSLAEVGGPSLGALLVQAASAPFAILLDGLSFLASAAGLLAIRRREPAPDRPPRRNLRSDLLAGFALTLRDRVLLAFAGEAATYNFFWQAVQVLLPLFVVRELGFSVGEFGLVLTIGSVGALLGAALTARVARRFGLGRTVVVAAVAGDLAPLALPGVHGHGPAAFTILACAFFVQGAGITGCNVHVNSIRQQITPPGLLGRMNAAYRLVVYGVVPLGALAGGALAAAAGVRVTLLAATAGLLTTSLWLVFSPVRRARTIDDLPTRSVPAPT